ncbi:hypothetical protein BJ944DRAFT_264732 [Cunninghamella echinulata]|nr:hypothetical protein BJ944DRAFT_264732 [Cunninghamella echinulata]
MRKVKINFYLLLILYYYFSMSNGLPSASTIRTPASFVISFMRKTIILPPCLIYIFL